MGDPLKRSPSVKNLLFCVLSLGLATSLSAATVHHWSFEDDTLAPDGALAVFEEGGKPVHAEDVVGSQIWDGGSYTLALKENRRSVHFAEVPVTKLAPAGGEIRFAGGEQFRLPSLTVECFIRVEKQLARFALLVSKRRGNGSTWSVAVNPQGVVSVRFDTQQGDSRVGFNRTVSTGTRVDDGRWHHVAMTFDHALRGCALYVDYRLCKKATLHAPLVYDEAELTIGRGLNGWIDEVRISDGVLHQEQFLRATQFFSDSLALGRKKDGVMLDLTPTRVQTAVSLGWEKVGTLKPKSVDEIPGDFWSLGCETLDRDLADWDAYKGYLKPLGIKRIRLQGGWNKTEKKKGVYDFAWLDHIVDSAHDLGLEVCLETSYGNRLYEPRAGLGPGGALPAGEETLKAWDAWVEAMVRHYRPKGVREWMMYNEPNLRRENTIEKIVAFNARTAETVKRIDPEAKIAGLVAAGLRIPLIESWLKGLREMDKLDHFEWVIYHGYGANPDSLAPGMEKAKELVRQYSPTIKLWQGEAGCASEEVQYALSGIDWTELSHAKWNARRMLCDFAHGIESTVFTISDLSYSKSFISRYGLLKTGPDNSIIKVKTAYYVVNNVVSVFNDSVTVNGEAKVEVSPADGLSVYAFRDRETGHDLIALWDSSAMPIDPCELTTVDVAVTDLKLSDPVWVDLLTSRIYRIPAANISKVGRTTTLKEIPVFDSPVILTDRSILSYVQARKPKKKPRPGPQNPKRSAKTKGAFPLKPYRLFGTQKPAPAVIIHCADQSRSEWVGEFAETLRSTGVHAFVLDDPSKSLANAVAHVRSQATGWQVDPKQIGVSGDAKALPDYQKLGADFAVIFRAQTKPSQDANLKIIDAVKFGIALDEDSAWLSGLLKWLELRKTKVF
jgi:polysaccharide biosynthesis protein PslG